MEKHVMLSFDARDKQYVCKFYLVRKPNTTTECKILPNMSVKRYWVVAFNTTLASKKRLATSNAALWPYLLIIVNAKNVSRLVHASKGVM